MNTKTESFVRFDPSKKQIFISVILVVLVFGSGSYSHNPILTKADNFFYDIFLKITATGDVSNQITVIDIDEISLSAVGQWPWPRYLLAGLVKELSVNRPAAMGLDILLPEPDRTSLKNIRRQFQKDFGLDLGFTGVPPALQDNDLYLAHIFKLTEIVGARYFYFDYINKKPVGLYTPFAVKDESGSLKLNQAQGVLTNTSPVESALKYTGFLNNQSDIDGLLRTTPLLASFNDQIFTNLSLSTFLKAHQIREVQVRKGLFGMYIQADSYKIPITPDGYIHIRFSGPSRAHKYISAVDILNHAYSPADVEGKILFIGSSATGLNDIHQTIFDPNYPGIEVHAAILSSIYKDCQIIIPIWSKHLVAGGCLLAGLAMIVLLSTSTSPLVLGGGSLVLLCILLLSSIICMVQFSLFVSPGLPVIITLFTFISASFLRFNRFRKATIIWFKKLAEAQQITIGTVVNLVETRDPETGRHVIRTQHYARALVTHLKRAGLFSDILTDEYIEMLFNSTPLHDIGKVGIPDRILLKPDKLSDEEFEIMKTHTTIGRETLERAAKNDKDNFYLKMGAQIAGTHHEKWNGKGYPDGLFEEDIPLCGRIMSICDVYDALISQRCYKPPFSHEKAMKIILEEKGVMFDPRLVDAFQAIEETIQSIASKFKDEIEDQPTKA